jgi:hypothetical protein
MKPNSARTTRKLGLLTPDKVESILNEATELVAIFTASRRPRSDSMSRRDPAKKPRPITNYQLPIFQLPS